jgi:hypothetical protein
VNRIAAMGHPSKARDGWKRRAGPARQRPGRPPAAACFARRAACCAGAACSQRALPTGTAAICYLPLQYQMQYHLQYPPSLWLPYIGRKLRRWGRADIEWKVWRVGPPPFFNPLQKGGRCEGKRQEAPAAAAAAAYVCMQVAVLQFSNDVRVEQSCQNVDVDSFAQLMQNMVRWPARDGFGTYRRALPAHHDALLGLSSGILLSRGFRGLHALWLGSNAVWAEGRGRLAMPRAAAACNAALQCPVLGTSPRHGILRRPRCTTLQARGTLGVTLTTQVYWVVHGGLFKLDPPLKSVSTWPNAKPPQGAQGARKHCCPLPSLCCSTA